MKKRYNVWINSVTNVVSDPRWFCGTGFLGESFSTYEEFKQLLYKYAKLNGIWKEEIELSFSLAESIDKLKEIGNRECKTNGFVEFFTLQSAFTNDPFKEIKIYWAPGKYIHNKTGNEFPFILVRGKSGEPRCGKLSSILEEIGITF